MTLKCIAGIETPDEGYIECNGRVLFDSSRGIDVPPQKRNIGYMFQQYALFPNMTVADNIAIGMKGSKHQRRNALMHWIERFQLTGLEHRYPRELSGGQQQRVALARMLATKPEVLLFDEPFSAMDLYLKEELQEQLQDVLHEYAKIALFVTHNQEEVYRFCNRLIVLHQGTAVEEGETKQVFATPNNLLTAQFVGCKNVSTIQRGDGQEVIALDWNLHIPVRTTVPQNVTHLGIRARDIHITSERKEEGYSIPCHIQSVFETPSEWHVRLQPVDASVESSMWSYKSKQFVQEGLTPGTFVWANVRAKDLLWLESE